jgi:pilus assembly protein CpaB
MEVSVVTLLVDPSESERLTLASTEGKIQLALRNPLDKTAPATSGVRPAALLGYAAAPRPVSAARPRIVAAAPVAVPALPPAPTVEMIRGDKRAQEVVRQE